MTETPNVTEPSFTLTVNREFLQTSLSALQAQLGTCNHLRTQYEQQIGVITNLLGANSAGQGQGSIVTTVAQGNQQGNQQQGTKRVLTARQLETLAKNRAAANRRRQAAARRRKTEATKQAGNATMTA
jgi:uncharacterized phage infection (PIP) family protein YhgE